MVCGWLRLVCMLIISSHSWQDHKVSELEGLLRDAQAAVHASGGSLRELRHTQEDLQAQVRSFSAELQASAATEAALRTEISGLKTAATTTINAAHAAAMAEKDAIIEQLQQEKTDLSQHASQAQQTTLALLLSRNAIAEFLPVPVTSMVFETVLQTGPGLSISRFIPELREVGGVDDESDGIDSESDVLMDSSASSDDTLSNTLGGAVDAPRPRMKRTLTADDSGWFS